MKNYVSKMLLLSAMVVAFGCSATSQVIVRVRPNEPVYTRPIAPSPRHVWIEGGWVERGGRYEWSNGYWMLPRPGMVWIPGGWCHRRGGWAWVPGHWRRRF